jgi:hypothetical protein
VNGLSGGYGPEWQTNQICISSKKCVILDNLFYPGNLKMKKHVNYKILPELRLILECCKGEASVGETINMKKNELSDILYNPDYNILVDFQEFETRIDAEINESISSFFDFLRSINQKCRVAFLTSEPHQVVISMILKRLSSEMPVFRIDVFSTVEAAVRYLGIPAKNLALIKNKIIELNRNTA